MNMFTTKPYASNFLDNQIVCNLFGNRSILSQD